MGKKDFGSLDQRLLIEYCIEKIPQQEIYSLLGKGRTLREILALDYIATHNGIKVFNGATQNQNFVDYISGEVIRFQRKEQKKKNRVFPTPLKQMAFLAYKELIRENKSQEMFLYAQSKEDYKALAVFDIIFEGLSKKRRELLEEQKTIEGKCDRAAALYMFQTGTEKIKGEIRDMESSMGKLNKWDLTIEDIEKYRQFIKNSPPEPDIDKGHGKIDREYEAALLSRQNSIDRYYKLVEDKINHKKRILGSELEALAREVTEIDKKNALQREDIGRLDEISGALNRAAGFYRAFVDEKAGLNIIDNVSLQLSKIKTEYEEYKNREQHLNETSDIIRKNREKIYDIFLGNDFFNSYLSTKKAIDKRMEEACSLRNRYLLPIINNIENNYWQFIEKTKETLLSKRAEFNNSIKTIEDKISEAGFFGKLFANSFRREKIKELQKCLIELNEIENQKELMMA